MRVDAVLGVILRSCFSCWRIASWLALRGAMVLMPVSRTLLNELKSVDQCLLYCGMYEVVEES